MDLRNHFLTVKKSFLENNELSPQTFYDYNRVTDRIIDAFGRGCIRHFAAI